MRELHFILNGRARTVGISPDATLLEVIREVCGLTGTKEGCGEGDCGGCTVLVDEMAVNSCIYPAVQAEGHSVLTVEGLEQNGTLHILQQKFLEHGAVQCGYCTPGMLMAAYALLLKNPSPSEAEIRRAISGNLCRCTGYAPIVAAVKDTAAIGLEPVQGGI